MLNGPCAVLGVIYLGVSLGYRRGLVDVRDRYGYTDAVALAGRVGSGDGNGVGAHGLKVQGGPIGHRDLACVQVDVEGSGIGAAQGVDQRVVVGVLGGDRVAHGSAGRSVFVHGPSGRRVKELGGAIDVRLSNHRVDRYSMSRFGIGALTVFVGCAGTQEAAYVDLKRRVCSGSGAADVRPSDESIG